MIARDQVATIIAGLVNTSHPQHPGDLKLFRADPIRAIASIAKYEDIVLSRLQAELMASVLLYPIALRTLYLLESTRESEMSVGSSLAVVRPTLRLAVLMQGSVVLLGLALVVSSLWASIDGKPALAAALGAVGLTSFTGLFLTRPFDDLYKSLRRRIQMEVIALGHSKQLGMWRSYAHSTAQFDHSGGTDTAVVARLAFIAQRTVDLISRYVDGAVDDQPLLNMGLVNGAAWVASSVDSFVVTNQVPLSSRSGKPGEMMLEKVAMMDKTAVLEALLAPELAEEAAELPPFDGQSGAVPFNMTVTRPIPLIEQATVQRTAPPKMLMDKAVLLEKSPASEAPTPVWPQEDDVTES